MLVCGQAVILVPSPTPFPPLFHLLLNLFNMAPRYRIRLIGFSAFSQDRQLRRLESRGFVLKTKFWSGRFRFCEIRKISLFVWSRHRYFGSTVNTNHGSIKLALIISRIAQKSARLHKVLLLILLLLLLLLLQLVLLLLLLLLSPSLSPLSLSLPLRLLLLLLLLLLMKIRLSIYSG